MLHADFLECSRLYSLHSNVRSECSTVIDHAVYYPYYLISGRWLHDMGGSSCTAFYNAHVIHLPRPPALRMFQEWISFDHKFTRIAAGGSIYSLLLLAGLNLRCTVAKVHGNIPYNVAAMLRHPRTAKSGKFSSLNHRGEADSGRVPTAH